MRYYRVESRPCVRRPHSISKAEDYWKVGRAQEVAQSRCHPRHVLQPDTFRDNHYWPTEPDSKSIGGGCSW